MLPAARVEAAAPRGAGDEAELDEVWLDHLHDRVARFGQAGRRRAVESFSWARIGDETLAVYRDVLG